MNTALSDTILYVTGKPGIENTSQQSLESMIAEYPYFAPAQLVYATKLKSENSPQLQNQVQKAGLFFNNFKWLQYQLLEVGSNGFNFFSNKDYSLPSIVDSVEALSNAENTVMLEEIIEDTNPANFNSVAIKANDFMPSMPIPTVEEIKGIMSGIDDGREMNELVVTPFTQEVLMPFMTNELVDINPEVVTENNVLQELPTKAIIEKINENVVEPLVEKTSDIHAEIEALKNNWYAHQQEVQPLNEDLEQIEVVKETKPEIVEVLAVTNNIDVNQQQEVTTPKVEENMQEVIEVYNFPGISTDIAQLKQDWNKPIESIAEQSLSFETEPYYTIDYFASQGIKFDYTKEPHDKLTSKMLRFTDWLKKMKTVKPEQEVISDDPELDSAIQNIASMSNQTKEVITETMAAIFAKQGKTEKAIQLYIKLSFLIPDKSSYFATQIKELKGI